MKAPFWFTAGVLTGVTASVLLYFAFHSPIASPPATAQVSRAVGTTTQAPSMEQATARLEARLESNGGSAADWELLAKSYEFLGRPDAAARARQRTTPTTPMSDSLPSASAVAKLTAVDAMPPPTSSASGPASAAAEISGTVSIENRLAGRVDHDAILFIYAKAVDAPGPPLAVLRLTADRWPVSFRLDDSMAMLPTRRLSQFQKVIVEARISRSGQATPAAGDLYVTSNTVSPSSGKKLALVISHEIG